GGGEGFGWGGGPRHARLVAEDRAAGARGRGVYRQHRDLVAFLREVGAERVDGGRLADTGRAGDADAHSLAGRAEQLLHQPVRGLLVVGALALHQGYGARQRRAVAGAQLAGEGGGVGEGGHRAVTLAGILELRSTRLEPYPTLPH